MKERMIRQVREIRRIEVTREDLEHWLRRKLGINREAKLEIFFKVPGGADWSNMDINIDNDNPLHVTVEENSTEEDAQPIREG